LKFEKLSKSKPSSPIKVDDFDSFWAYNTTELKVKDLKEVDK